MQSCTVESVARGTMFIQVRSVVLSHECDVIVDPSAEAAFPTRTLVQESNSGGSPGRTALACEAGRNDRPRRARPRTRKDRDLGFLIARHLRAVYSTPTRRRSIARKRGRSRRDVPA